MPGRQFPFRRVPGRGLSAYRDQRAEGLSRRRVVSRFPLRDFGQARLLRQGRRPPPARRPRRGGARARTAQFLRAGGRRRARPRDQRQVRPQARLRRRDGGLGPAGKPGGEPVDPGRRSQHRAARARRLEPQGAPQRGQPHPDRGRQTKPAPRPPDPGSTRCANSCPTIRSSTRGGAIARSTGRRPTRGGASTTSGSARRSPIPCKSMRVLRDARGWQRPSDHAPVMATLAL